MKCHIRQYLIGAKTKSIFRDRNTRGVKGSQVIGTLKANQCVSNTRLNMSAEKFGNGLYPDGVRQHVWPYLDPNRLPL